jgi:cellulase/cellobiase CelA1
MGGGSVRPFGKSGLTFDYILGRLQGESQKTWEMSAEPHNLTGAMNDIPLAGHWYVLVFIIVIIIIIISLIDGLTMTLI